MSKIFISYRRADSQYVTDSIYAQMVKHFGKDAVFLDVGSIPFGVDFRKYLSDQVAAHEVVLVIIGTDWGRIMQERADQETDFVRYEIESALEQGKLVVPVLVKNAQMPNFADLPKSISALQWRNSATIRRQPDLDGDCERLAEGIQQFLQSQTVTKTDTSGQQTELPQEALPQEEPAKEQQPQQEVSPPTSSTSKDMMPAPFDWIKIPASSGIMRTTDKNVMLDTPTESYWISKYPVTNAQFREFVKAGGYYTETWWTTQGWKRRQKKSFTEPGSFSDDNRNGDAQPVTGLSWYEAVAFCLWLGEQSGENIMLPTEAQWQYAAQGAEGYLYPWGNEWDGENCLNGVDTGFFGGPIKTSDVTQFEGKGDSPFGVVDMAGNIREWGLTDYHNQTNDMNSNDGYRITRGGGYIDGNADKFRCDNREMSHANTRESWYGFRIVRSH